MPDRFCIKDGYQSNPGPVYFLDDPKGDIVFQPDVLSEAESICEGYGLSHIVDVGCGWAEKLANVQRRHPEWRYTGIDYGDNIKHCLDSYAWGSWQDQDLETPVAMDFSGSVVVASDVIEHLVNPDVMLDWLHSGNPEVLVISTPERDLHYGTDHMGPSPNLCHVREWNLSELVAYVESRGWTVMDTKLTRGNDRDNELVTSLVVAKP